MIAPESKVVLTLSGVRVARGARAFYALDGVDLQAHAGEALFLLGPNGAGKTTLLHVCAGVLSPLAGDVVLSHRGPPSMPRARRAIGFVPQALAIYAQLTVQENLVFFGQMLGVPKELQRDRTRAGLELSGLAARAHDRAGTLSGGMQRRLSFACAVLHAPKLLLLDEPTAGVDAESREQLYDAIEEMKARGTAVICSTHSPDEAARLADRIVLMARGRVTDARTRQELLAQRVSTPDTQPHAGSSQLAMHTAMHAAMNTWLARGSES